MIDDDLWMTNVKKEVTYTGGGLRRRRKVTAATKKEIKQIKKISDFFFVVA